MDNMLNYRPPPHSLLRNKQEIRWICVTKGLVSSNLVIASFKIQIRYLDFEKNKIFVTDAASLPIIAILLSHWISSSQWSSSPAFYGNIKEFLLWTFGTHVYLVDESSYSIYLNIAYPWAFLRQVTNYTGVTKFTGWAVGIKMFRPTGCFDWFFFTDVSTYFYQAVQRLLLRYNRLSIIIYKLTHIRQGKSVMSYLLMNINDLGAMALSAVV